MVENIKRKSLTELDIIIFLNYLKLHMSNSRRIEIVLFRCIWFSVKVSQPGWVSQTESFCDPLSQVKHSQQVQLRLNKIKVNKQKLSVKKPQNQSNYEDIFKMLKFTLSNGSGAGTMASNASSSDAESLTSGQVNRLRQNWAVHEGINFIIFWMNPNIPVGNLRSMGHLAP